MLDLTAPGIWRLSHGSPEPVTPLTLRTEPPKLDGLTALPVVAACPIPEAAIRFTRRPRGLTIEIPIPSDKEQFYGLGLQLKKLNQTGRKRTLRVNSDPVADTGDSHAPVPFLASTAGWGIVVDSARYTTWYVGGNGKRRDAAKAVAGEPDKRGAATTEELYAAGMSSHGTLVIDVPGVSGANVYLIGGPTLLNVVQRYNLFSGGGCLPPMWGLGIWYRMYNRGSQADAVGLMKSFRADDLPCDVLGLEPGWQTHAYSCSYVWNKDLFPDSDKVIADAGELGFKLNLWEHVFTHPTSPIYEKLKPTSGDFDVWGGLVPDLTDASARETFGGYHREQFVKKGISGFKLDECDNSDFIGSSWSFPEASAFPSGIDGEQMHSLLGVAYQRTLMDGFRAEDKRTYSAVRSSGAFAASLPFVLYSDLYDHRDFVRGVPVSSFSGLLWTPEVRDARSSEDLLRRLQSVVFSPQALVNAWYIKRAPWLQFDRDKNNAGELLPDAKELEAQVRELFKLRMSLVPYLYAAFSRYRYQGVPPFRALAMDHPTDPKCHNIDDQFLIGPDLMVAPVFAGQTERSVYFPAGRWHDFAGKAAFEGGKSHSFKPGLNEVLLFVRDGSILPWADPVSHVDEQTVFDITLRTYGDPKSLRDAELFEDDGVSFAFERGAAAHVWIHPDKTVQRSGGDGGAVRERYRIKGWETVAT